MAQPAPDTFIIPQIHKHNKHYTAPGPGLSHDPWSSHHRLVAQFVQHFISLRPGNLIVEDIIRVPELCRSVSLFVIQHLLSVSNRVESEVKLQP